MSQAPPKLVLVLARSLIADRSQWLRNGWMEDSRTGARRCAYQAVVDAGTTLGLDPSPALWLLAGVIAGDGADPRDAIPGFNDCHAHHDVMAMLDRAIALL